MTNPKRTNRAVKKAAARKPAKLKPVRKAKNQSAAGPNEKLELDLLVHSLRTHDRLLETSDENAPLPSGVTHVLLPKKGQRGPQLIEKRKSFF